MNTFSPRSSFHHAVVTRSGVRRSISRANASAQRRTTGNSHFGSIRTGDMDAAVAGRLRPAGVADLRQRLAHDSGDPLAVVEIGSRLRVDVDAELVRMLGIGPPRRPGVEVDHGEVRRPDDLRELRHAELVGVSAGGKGDARSLDPLGALLGHALLVDLLAFDPVREAAQLGRPLAQRPHDPVPDRDVVVDEVALRVPGARKEHLVRVRHLDDALPDLELDERRRHRPTVSALPPSTAMGKYRRGTG